jgi:hypothetical protein
MRTLANILALLNIETMSSQGDPGNSIRGLILLEHQELRSKVDTKVLFVSILKIHTAIAMLDWQFRARDAFNSSDS